MTHVTCRLTAKNRDQLRDPTRGNRVWATFTFLGWVKKVSCCTVIDISKARQCELNGYVQIGRQLGGNFHTDLATLPQCWSSKMAAAGDTADYRLRRRKLTPVFFNLDGRRSVQFSWQQRSPSGP